MNYQLVLQWPSSSIWDYDTLLEVEDALRAKLSKRHVIDGHDAGSGETNIFIHTNNPNGAFVELQGILGTRDFWGEARVAYREITGTDYNVLWPPGFTDFKVA